MKRLLYALAAACIMSSTAAAQERQMYKSVAGEGNRTVQVMLQNGRQASVNITPRAAARLFTPPTGTAEDIIYEPEGQKFTDLLRTDISINNFMGSPEILEYPSAIGEYVIGDDGTIYIQPITTYKTGGYIKLEKQADGTYTAHTPQVFYDQTNPDGSHILAWATRFILKQTPDGAYYYDAEETGDGGYNTDMKFTFENGVLQQADMTLDETGLPNELLAMTDPDGNWAIYGSGCITIAPLPEDEKPAVLPEDAEERSVVLLYKDVNSTTGELTDLNKKLRYATSPSEPGTVYINNPSDRLPDQWIKGQVESDGSWTFKRQYLGTYPLANAHVWFIPGTYTIGTETQYGMTYYGELYTLTDEITLKYDAGKLAYTSGDDEAMLINISTDEPWFIEAFDAPGIQQIADVAATPADPVILTVQPNYGTGGYFSFTQPGEDVDGNFIDTDKMYYRVYADGDETAPFMFTTEEYKYLEEDMTDVPYEYGDNIHFTHYGATHGFYFYRTDVTKWGVQSVYRGGGEERVSNIVWVDVPGTGISSVTTDEAAKVEYYDLQGRRVSNPTKGIFIKKTTTANGTRSVKIMK